MTSDWVAEPERHGHLAKWLGVVVTAIVLITAPVSLVAEGHEATGNQHEALGDTHAAAGDEHSGAEEHEDLRTNGGHGRRLPVRVDLRLERRAAGRSGVWRGRMLEHIVLYQIESGAARENPGTEPG